MSSGMDSQAVVEEEEVDGEFPWYLLCLLRKTLISFWSRDGVHLSVCLSVCTYLLLPPLKALLDRG